jgi:hypothetical protein
LPLFALGFVPGALLTLLMYYGRRVLDIPWPAAVAVMVLLGAVAVAALVAFQRRRWSNLQHFALTAGLLAVYLAGGFLTSATLHGPADLPGHAVIAVLCLGALGLAWRRAGAAYQGISLPS